MFLSWGFVFAFFHSLNTDIFYLSCTFLIALLHLWFVSLEERLNLIPSSFLPSPPHHLPLHIQILHHLFFPPHFFTRTYQLNSRTALTLLDTHLPHPSGPFQPPRVPLSHPFAPLLPPPPPPPPSLASFPRSGTSIRERKKRGLYLLTALCLYYSIDVHDKLNIKYIFYIFTCHFLSLRSPQRASGYRCSSSHSKSSTAKASCSYSHSSSRSESRSRSRSRSRYFVALLQKCYLQYFACAVLHHCFHLLIITHTNTPAHASGVTWGSVTCPRVQTEGAFLLVSDPLLHNHLITPTNQ